MKHTKRTGPREYRGCLIERVPHSGMWRTMVDRTDGGDEWFEPIAADTLSGLREMIRERKPEVEA